MILELLILVAGLILLIKGSNYFVKSAGNIAKIFGVSEFVIGLTLIALGTSLPELVSAIFASLRHQSELISGNIIGANIANIGLIIGIAAVISVIKTKKEMVDRDGYILLFSSFLFVVFLYDKILSRVEGIIFLTIYTGYMIFLLESKPEFKEEYHFKEFLKYFFKFKYFSYIKNKFSSNNKTKKKLSKILLIKNAMILILSGISVIIGAKYLIKEALFFANSLKIHQTIIGVMISLGTTLPEMSVAITAAKKKYGNIAVGNAMGSCITNLLFILGIAAVISPIRISNLTLFYTVPFMIIFIILLLFFIKSDWKITKKEGFIFLILYLLFLFLILSKI